MDEIEHLRHCLQQEGAARQEAENLLRAKSQALYALDQQLEQTKDELEEQVRERTETFQASEKRFRRFIEAATDIIYQTDAEGHFTYANPVAVRKLGLNDPTEILGHHYLELVHPECRKRLSQFYIKQFLNKQQNTYQEFRLNTQNDEVIWIGQNVQLVIDKDEVLGFQSVARDITRRKQIESELQAQRDFAQQILTHMGQGVTMVDADSRFLYVNPAYAQMLGYNQEEVVGKTPFDFVHPDDLIILEEARNRRKVGENSVYEIGLQGKDGRVVPVLITGTPRQQEGRPVGSIAVITDLTERKQLEETLRQARDQALEASRLKSEFLANMSHEIRTPLNGVIGMTELLSETALDDDQQEFVDIIKTSGNALLEIINDVLDFSKISAGKLDLEYQPFNLRETVEEALDILAPKAVQKGLELAFMKAHGIPSTIMGDVMRLRQILVNLLSNAVKFTEKGEVVVSVSKVEQDGRSDQLHFSVRDTGIGIPAESLNGLFQSFTQVDASTTRKYGGTGLGLTISKKLCERMGGTMWVESTVGEGSTFHFTIDLEIPPNYQTAILPELPELVGRRLLIVDDNETNRHILVRQAEMWGMRPKAATSAIEALDWLRDDRAFDLAILDMQMPQMDGYMLAQEIRQLPNYAMMPLIMLSSIGHKPLRSAQDLFAAHATKPIKVAALRKIVQSVCASYLPVTTNEYDLAEISGDKSQEKSLRILLAEDNEINQKVALGMLSQLGFQADVAVNGLQVIQALESQAYDVILIDIQMPEMDGLETTQYIRAHWPTTQQPHIVAMTANAVSGDRERFLTAGMNDYVSKPVRIKALAAALDVVKHRMAEKA
jgi:PAS domain S-box-containing protein